MPGAMRDVDGDPFPLGLVRHKPSESCPRQPTGESNRRGPSVKGKKRGQLNPMALDTEAPARDGVPAGAIIQDIDLKIHIYAALTI